MCFLYGHAIHFIQQWDPLCLLSGDQCSNSTATLYSSIRNRKFCFISFFSYIVEISSSFLFTPTDGFQVYKCSINPNPLSFLKLFFYCRLFLTFFFSFSHTLSYPLASQRHYRPSCGEMIKKQTINRNETSKYIFPRKRILSSRI